MENRRLQISRCTTMFATKIDIWGYTDIPSWYLLMKQYLCFRISKLVCEFAMSVSLFQVFSESQLTIFSRRAGTSRSSWKSVTWNSGDAWESQHANQWCLVLRLQAANLSEVPVCVTGDWSETGPNFGLGHYSSQIGSVWKWSVPQRLPFWQSLTNFDIFWLGKSVELWIAAPA